jgi:hypothetical protein
MSVTSLWSKCQYAKCFGHWLVSDPECIRCAVSDACEKRTKAKSEESERSTDVEPSEEAVEQSSISPLDYLIQSLSGKFEHETGEKDRAVIHKFRLDGKVVIAIVIGAFGKIKIMSIPKNKQKIFGSLQSIDEAESVLAEML